MAIGATLLLDGNSHTLGALSGEGDVVNDNDTDTAATLMVGGGDGSGDFSGIISDGTGAGGIPAFSLIKIGAGTQTLSGDSIYSGATTVMDGTLDVTGSLVSAISVADGATLSGEGSTDGLLTLGDNTGGGAAGAGAILTIDASTEPGAFTSLSLTSDVTGGTHTVNFSASPTGTGDITILNYGMGTFTGATTDFIVGSGLTLSGRGGMFNNDVSDTNNKKITLSTGFATRTWAAAASTSNWIDADTVDNNWVEGDNDFFNGDFVIFTDSNVDAAAPTTAQTIILTGSVAPTAVTFSNNDFAYTFDDTAAETLTATGGITTTGTNDVTLNVQITGATDITHSGTGSLTLGTGVTNDFTGAVVVDGSGSIIAGSDTFLGNAANTLTISNGSTLEINGARNLKAYGPGSIKVSGVGNGANANAGAIINTGGADAPDAFDTELDLTGDTTFGGTNRIDIDGALSISGTNVTITYVGTNNLWLSGNNTTATELDFIVVDAFGGSRNDGIVFNGSGLGNAVVNIESGALKARGSETVSNTINLNTGAASIGVSNNGTFTIAGTLNVNADDAEIDPTSNIRVVQISGTLAGTANNLQLRGGIFKLTNTATVTYTGSFDMAEANQIATFELGDGQNLSNTINLGNAGTGANVLRVTGTNSAEFSGDIVGNINGDGDFDVSAAADATLTLSGVISDDGNGPGLDKIGDGLVILSGANTYSDTTRIQAGTLQADVADVIGVSGAFGHTNDITFEGGTLQYTANSAGTDYSARIKTSTAAIALDTNGQDVTLASAIDNTNTAGLTKLGTGTLSLTAANAYTGTTTISAGTLQLGNGGSTGSLDTTGTLLIDGSTHAGSSVNVLSGGTLGGSGDINGVTTIQSGGSHTAGTTGTGNTGTDASIQTLTGASLGNLTYDSGATVTWDLISNASNNNNAGVAGTDYDQFAITGGSAGLVTFDTNLNFDIIAGTGVDFDQAFWNANLNEWKVWDTGFVEGASGVSITTNIYNGSFSLFEGSQYGGGDATGIWLVQTAVVPEPSTYAIFGLGLALFGWTARRRRKAAAEVVGS